MSNKKFELVEAQCLEVLGAQLFRIRALRSFASVEAGDLGGYVEKESNLSHDGDAWVHGNAQVFGDAQVFGNAWVCGDAQVFGNARVYGNAQVFGDAQVFGNARVYGNAEVSVNAEVYGNAAISWFSHVGSEDGTLTAFKTEAGISVTRGCFLGTLDEFEAAVQERHGSSQIGDEYRLLVQFIRLRLGKGVK